MIREQRYFVLKVKDIEKYLNADDKMRLKRICRDIELDREDDGKRPLQCVCVEDDWPEYEQVWSMITARVDGASLPAAEEDARDGWISVEERLPEFTRRQPVSHSQHLKQSEPVMVATKDGRVFETVYSGLGFANINSRTDKVTHWMPRPDHPAMSQDSKVKK